MRGGTLMYTTSMNVLCYGCSTATCWLFRLMQASFFLCPSSGRCWRLVWNLNNQWKLLMVTAPVIRTHFLGRTFGKARSQQLSFSLCTFHLDGLTHYPMLAMCKRYQSHIRVSAQTVASEQVNLCWNRVVACINTLINGFIISCVPRKYFKCTYNLYELDC